MISWSRLAFVAVVVVLAQVTFFDQTMFLDLARIDLPAFLLVGLANKLEPDPAAISGFGIGIVLDLFYSSPFGLFALLFCFSGWAIANITPVVDVADRFTRYAARAVEFGLLWLLTWFIGGVFGMGRIVLEWTTLSELLLLMALGGFLSDPDRGLARPIAVA
jgi:rod shape-determining protein MreD